MVISNAYAEASIGESPLVILPDEIDTLLLRVGELETAIRKALPDLRSSSKSTRLRGIRQLETVLERQAHA